MNKDWNCSFLSIHPTVLYIPLLHQSRDRAWYLARPIMRGYFLSTKAFPSFFIKIILKRIILIRIIKKVHLYLQTKSI